MKTPFSNFFKRVLGKESKRPDSKINKPVTELKEEKKVSVPKHEPKSYHRPPVFTTHLAKRKRDKRQIRNRIQKHSRIINRRAA